jgi:hypothetical protein
VAYPSDRRFRLGYRTPGSRPATWLVHESAGSCCFDARPRSPNDGLGHKETAEYASLFPPQCFDWPGPVQALKFPHTVASYGAERMLPPESGQDPLFPNNTRSSVCLRIGILAYPG